MNLWGSTTASRVQSEEEAFWFEHLTCAQVKALQQLRSLVQDKGQAPVEFCDDITLCRFLKARKWAPAPAFEMWRNMLAWRQQNVNNISAPFSAAERKEILRHYPHFYHKTDMHGRPVYYEFVEELKPQNLLRLVSIKRLIQFHILGWEHARQKILPSCSLAAQRDVFTCTTVVDLKGLSLSSFTKEARTFICEIATIDQSNYPEHLGQMFIVNAPMIFTSMWAVIKPWLEPRTQKKIHVVSEKQTWEVLGSVIPKDNLITRFGGNSEINPCAEQTVGPWSEPALLAKMMKQQSFSSSTSSLIAANA